jgi:uncharacterized integral membrane protein
MADEIPPEQAETTGSVTGLDATPGHDEPSSHDDSTSQDPKKDRHDHAAVPKQTNAGRLWVAIGVAVVLLILLIIFIAENSTHVRISFLGAHGSISSGLAMLISAVAGAIVTLLVGTARILQLRHEVRRHRRAKS